VHAVAVAAGIVLAAAGYAALGLAALFIAAIILVPLYMGRGARLSALGVFYVGLPAIALLWMRGDEPYGFTAVLFIFAVVWGSDTAAYAAGRTIGGPKLWPRVSPNKTWAGFIGALAAGAASGAIFAALVGDADAVRLVLLGIGLAAVAQAGDLAESALKRLFHLKDASDLIPGHGGFMDRMDSLVAAATAAALLALLIDAHAPARALMLGV
jgi:phosphatidate cytidylyltransferase